jgi:hypothetical protein
LKELEESAGGCLSRIRIRREELLREEAENRKKQVESKLCCVCLVNERSTLLLPCRHLVLCAGCSKDERLKQCPVCRQDIEDVMEIYS